LYLPAETLYGPEAVKRFMGLDRLSPPPVIPQVIAVVKDEDDEEPNRPVARASNQRSLNLGWRFIGFGDARFGKREYADAYQHYRKAAQAAPALADAYSRQGHALIALGRYEQAAKAIKRCLEIDPDWARSDFRNDELYADNQPAKAAHIDALAEAATANPNDADLLLLVGVFLHFDGQPDRAKPFFERAARLAGADGPQLRGFLDPAGRPEQ
jgi:tetratricopeptide (TPR) repeat protein